MRTLVMLIYKSEGPDMDTWALINDPVNGKPLLLLRHTKLALLSSNSVLIGTLLPLR